MLIMSDRKIGEVYEIDPVEPWISIPEVLAPLTAQIRPPSRISVTDAAEANMRVEVAGMWQRYDRETAPYMVEVQDSTLSRLVTATAVVAPAQTGKTKALEAIAFHAVTEFPSPVQIVHMSEKDADAWVEEKLDQTIEHSPAIRARLGTGRDDSTFSRKRFVDCVLTIGYPVANQLSGRSRRLMLLTDFDHMRQQLGPKDRPEGSPFAMARQRVKTWGSRGHVFVEGTPGFPVTNRRWKPSPEAPHMLPPVAGGIVAIYNQGTRARWYWECRDCGGEFEPRIDRLEYPGDLSPAAAGAAAVLPCPHCGSIIEHRHKAELNRAALQGRGGWRHEAADGSLVAFGDRAMRDSSIASYALNGAAAAFATWAEIVAKLEEARTKAAELDDETDLATVHYTDIGVPFAPSVEISQEGLSPEFLREHMIDLPRGVCPDWARFVTTTVDVQKGRFVAQVTAWGIDLERVVIDRFDIVRPPAHAPDPENRAIDPARFVEDWDALLELGDRVYPVEGEAWGYRPFALVVDFQGEAGVSDNAEAFLRARRRAGGEIRWYLSRGHSGRTADGRIWYRAPVRGSGGKKARGIRLLNMAVDRLKDSVFAALSRGVRGRAAMHLGAWMGEEVFAPILEEFCAEEKVGDVWRKREGVTRNEAIDLSVQALAIVEFKGGARINPEAPPPWAAGGPSTPFAAALHPPAAPEAEAAEAGPESPPVTSTPRGLRATGYF